MGAGMYRLCLLLPVLSIGCGLPSIYAKKPAPSFDDDVVIDTWVEDIRSQSESGDWLLTRNYAFVGDLIATVGFGESLSHAAIYDKERDLVIEATSPKVQAVPLERFVRRYRRVLVARPSWMDKLEKKAALYRARMLVGEDYDWGGLLGLDDSKKYYCTEFVIDVANKRGAIDKPVWVTPAALLGVSDVVYDSGVREEMATRRLARDRWFARDEARAQARGALLTSR